MSGTLSPGATPVYCGLGLDFSVTTCNLRSTNAVLAFDGDDALELVCGGTTLDVIGQIGVDPGTEWGTGAASTADATLRRACDVTAGDPDGTDPFDPRTGWVALPIDTFGGFRSRDCP